MKKWIIGLSVLLVVVSGIILYNVNVAVKKEYIYEGISIEDIDVGEHSKEEALEILKNKKQSEIKDKFMKLTGNDEDFIIQLEDLGFDYEYKLAVDSAYSLGRDGSLFKRYKEIKSFEKVNQDIGLESYYDQEKIKENSINIAEEVNSDVVNSVFDFNGGNIKVFDSSMGYDVDVEALLSKIEENIYNLGDIDIPIEVIEPEYTKEYYSKINGVIGNASTSFKKSSPGRVNNIMLSTRVFDGKIIHPGESISYNSTVGPVTRSTGYEDAPVIIDGDLTPGIGGGICQTSTTLYNALLRADLTITERSHHSIPSSYMDKGLDAVVAGDYLDLKFRNDFDYPIYISSRVVDRVVYFDIYGDKKNRDYTIQMEAKIIEIIPHETKEVLKDNMEPGTREIEQGGRDGYKVVTYKHKVKDGKVINTKQVSSDYYRERMAIIHLGPEKIKPEDEDDEEDKPEDEDGEEESEE